MTTILRETMVYGLGNAKGASTLISTIYGVRRQVGKRGSLVLSTRSGSSVRQPTGPASPTDDISRAGHDNTALPTIAWFAQIALFALP